MNINNRTWVKASNIIGIVAIIALVYWVFAYTAIEVFGLRVFKKNLTEIFFMSVMGILALMSGALMVNIMLNLTCIAEKHHEAVAVSPGKTGKRRWLVFAASFPFILALLFAGDHLSALKKREALSTAAQSFVAAYPTQMARLADYHFDREWIVNTADTLSFYKRAGGDLDWDWRDPNIEIIVADTLNDTRVFLKFSDEPCKACKDEKELIPLKKQDFIRTTTGEERAWLARVFDEGAQDIRFRADDGSYEFFYPYRENGKTIVLYFSTYARYGKMGS
jgi:hypothetical protein